jgi:hypothetical protein
MGKNILLDLGQCLKIATIISMVVGIISGLAGLIIFKSDLKLNLEIIKATLLILGSLGLLIGSILLIKSPYKDKIELKHIYEWKEKYKQFSYKVVIIITSIIIIIYGGIIDWIVFIL